MPLQIFLSKDDSLETFYPGQQLSGTVEYTNQKQKEINSIIVTLRGNIETEHYPSRSGNQALLLGPRGPAKEAITLLEYKETLFKGPYTISAQTMAWPFDFTIPTEIQCIREGNKSPGFILDPSVSTPLPPSFRWDDYGISRDARAKIKYNLIAELSSPGILKNESAEIPITIRQRSLDPPGKLRLEQHEFTPSPRWSSRELRTQSHTLSQKFRRLTSKDPSLATPCIAFKAYIHFPNRLTPSQKFNIGISIQHYQVTENDPETPDLQFESLKCTLKSHIAMTAARTGLGSELSIHGDRFAEGTTSDASYKFNFEPVSLDLQGDIAFVEETCLKDWRNEESKQAVGDVGGDFVTYTVKRAHGIKVEAGIRHTPTSHIFRLACDFRFEVQDEYVSRLDGDSSNVSGGKEVNNELPRYVEDDGLPRLDDEQGKSTSVDTEN